MVRKKGGVAGPILAQASDADPRRRIEFTDDLIRHRRLLRTGEPAALVRAFLALAKDPDPSVRRTIARRMRMVLAVAAADGAEVWEALRALLGDPDAQHEAEESTIALRALLPEAARSEFVDGLLAALRDERQGPQGARLLGRLGDAIPGERRVEASRELVKAARAGGELAAESVRALARLARFLPPDVAEVRDTLVDTLRNDVFGTDPNSWERAYAPLRAAPNVVTEDFVGTVLALLGDSSPAARLRAASVLTAIRPAIPASSLRRCFERVLSLMHDRDDKVRDEAGDALRALLLSLPLLALADQETVVRDAIAPYPEFDDGQRFGLMSEAHHLHAVLDEAHKEVIVDGLLEATQSLRGSGIASAIHTAAALVVGSRSDLIDRVVQRTVELGHTGTPEVKGEVTQAWGDLLDTIPPGQGRLAVEELVRLASEHVRATFGDAWSILERNQGVLPVEAAPLIVSAFLREVAAPEASNLADAARTVVSMLQRMPPGTGLGWAPEDATRAALERLRVQASQHREEGIEALGALALLLPADRVPEVVDILGSLAEALQTRVVRDLDDDEGDTLSPAVARALGTTLPLVSGPASHAATEHLTRLGSRRPPVPEALGALVRGASGGTKDRALSALLRMATGRASGDVRCAALRELGRLGEALSNRSGEAVDALIELMDDPEEHVSGSALEALKDAFPTVPHRQAAILGRLVEAVERDRDPDAALVLNNLAAKVSDDGREQALKALRRAYEDSAGDEWDFRFAMAIRALAVHLPSERRTWLWSVRTG